MKKFLLHLLLGTALLLAHSSHAQTDDLPAPVGYSERVTSETETSTLLFRQATAWVETHFAYGPKTDLQADPAKNELHVTGTGKIKPVTPSGQELERTVRFDFVFRTTDSGYEYRVGAFRVIPNPKDLTKTVPLDEYLAQLATEKARERTHNVRRVTAQATSLASEVAMAFRSYMNSQPADGGGSVGLNAE